MTLTKQVKILDDKIKANKAQYDLDREAAKISALSSGELEKYEYLTGEDLGYKPDVVQKAKFEYSPIGKVFNKGLDEIDKKEALLKRLKSIEGKNRDQLDAIKDQGEKQLDAIKDQGEKQLDVIEKQTENKLKMVEKDEIVYLQDKTDEFFEMYPNSFDKKSKALLNTLAKNENKINYKNLFYRILLSDGKFHEFNFYKKYGILYDLLLNLVTKKTTVNSANDDQISFIINLMNGCSERKLIDIKIVKDEFFYNTVLAKAKKVFLDTKKKFKKGTSFLPDKFREYISNKEKGVSLNAMNLYNGRNKIIKLFESKDITAFMYAYDAKSDGVEESEQKFDKSIGERVKLRRQKADDKTDEMSNGQLDTTDMPDLETEEFAEQRRKHKGQGLKILTPKQMLSKLPICLAQLRAGNNCLTVFFV